MYPIVQDTRVEAFLDTLRLVPDDIILSMATRDFNMESPLKCLCGWAVQEMILQLAFNNCDRKNLRHLQSESVLAAVRRIYGGTIWEWQGIFLGVMNFVNIELIELAFVLRLDEAYERTTTVET
jgi:hypothetical protein